MAADALDTIDSVPGRPGMTEINEATDVLSRRPFREKGWRRADDLIDWF
jgi:hypothetical protein